MQIYDAVQYKAILQVIHPNLLTHPIHVRAKRFFAIYFELDQKSCLVKQKKKKNEKKLFKKIVKN